MASTLLPIDRVMRALIEARSPHEVIDLANRDGAMRRVAILGWLRCTSEPMQRPSESLRWHEIISP